MAVQRLGIVMNGITGRMGYNQHLVRSILAIRQQGGVKLTNGDRVMPDPILVGRNETKVAEIARNHGIERWTTDLDAALADPNDTVFFDSATTQMRPGLLAKAIDRGKHIYCEKPVATDLAEAVEIARDVLPKHASCVYIRQAQALGLGHAVLCAAPVVGNEPFAVLLADDLIQAERPCLAQMIETYAETGGNLVAVEDVPREETNRYGILDVARDDGRLAEAKGLVEKPAPEEAPSTLSIIGRYILTPDIFDIIENTPPGANGEVQITDALLTQAKKGCVMAYKYKGKRFDCGSVDGFVEATNYMYENFYKKP